MMKQIFIPSLNQDISYSIGKNAEDNSNIIDNSHDNDIWFHLQNSSSCHVIAHISNYERLDKKQLRQIIKQGAILCKSNSKSKSDTNVGIRFTYIRDIHHTRIIGTVIADNAKIIKV